MVDKPEYFGIPRERVVALVKEFSQEYLIESDIKNWYKNQGMPPSVLKEYYKSELGRYCLPSSLGGIPTNVTTQVYVIEELHRAAGCSLPIVSNFLSLAILRLLGVEGDFSFIREMLDSYGTPGFSEAISEPQAGSDVFAIKTTVKHIDGTYYLNGTKSFVSNGEFAPYILVLAKDEDDSFHNKSMTFWFVPRTAKGVSIYPIESIGQTMNPMANIHFENVELSEKFILKGIGNATRAIMPCFDIGRTFICAASLGLAEAAMDDALRIGSQRISFSKPITSLSQIQEKITDMEVGIRCMRALTYDAASKLDAANGFTDHQLNADFKLAATLAKRMVPKTATEIASEAMQILGGIGYTQLSRTGRIWNDCRGNQIAQGTDEIMVRIAAKRIQSAYLNDKL